MNKIFLDQVHVRGEARGCYITYKSLSIDFIFSRFLRTRAVLDSIPLANSLVISETLLFTSFTKANTRLWGEKFEEFFVTCSRLRLPLFQLMFKIKIFFIHVQIFARLQQQIMFAASAAKNFPFAHRNNFTHGAERYCRGSQARLNLVLLHGPYLLIIIFGGISNKKYFTNMLKTPSAHKLWCYIKARDSKIDIFI